MAKVNIKKEKLQDYLVGVFGQEISDLEITQLGKGCLGVGYALDFKVAGQPKRKVLKTLFPLHLGQDHFADRAQSLILAHHNYNKLDKHVLSSDVCGICNDGQLVSVGEAKEFFILMDEAKGKDYFIDLVRIAKTNRLTAKDKNRAIILANYLAKIHSLKQKSPSLYQRRIRDTVGNGGSIMGILDMYPKKLKWLKTADIENFVQKSIPFWVKDRYKTYRLCQVHGDFHPGNIWWQTDKEFIVLDRARGEFGEAADDVTALLINNIFFSVIYNNEFKGGLKKLMDIFWDTYLTKTKDIEMMEVIQPYFAFRAVVVCNPLFYPDSFFSEPKKADQIRQRMFNFASNALAEEKFKWSEINNYLNK